MNPGFRPRPFSLGVPWQHSLAWDLFPSSLPCLSSLTCLHHPPTQPLSYSFLHPFIHSCMHSSMQALAELLACPYLYWALGTARTSSANIKAGSQLEVSRCFFPGVVSTNRGRQKVRGQEHRHQCWEPWSQEPIVSKCQYFWTKKKSDMQMKCKMMQITDIEFQSKTTFGNKSAAEEGVDSGGEGASAGLNTACPPNLSPTLEAAVQVGASSREWAVRGARGSDGSPTQGTVMRFLGRGECEGRCGSEEHSTH